MVGRGVACMATWNVRPHFHALFQCAFMIWQYDEPVDLLWCHGRHCSDAAIGFEIVDKSTIMGKDSGSVDASYWDSEGHEKLRTGGRVHCYTVSVGVMYRAHF
jgi:hypothetical protein